MLIKILFEFDRFFKRQNIVKSRIHFNDKRGLYWGRGGGLITRCIFCLKVEGPINGRGGGGCNRTFTLWKAKFKCILHNCCLYEVKTALNCCIESNRAIISFTLKNMQFGFFLESPCLSLWNYSCQVVELRQALLLNLPNYAEIMHLGQDIFKYVPKLTEFLPREKQGHPTTIFCNEYFSGKANIN